MLQHAISGRGFGFIPIEKFKKLWQAPEADSDRWRFRR
jgi:hypothetical protein